MEFRIATQEDLDFVSEHKLYPNDDDKKGPERTDYVYTLDHGDYILGVGGFRLVTNTTAWAWFELTEYVGDHLVPTYRCIVEWMEIFCKNHGIIRLQAWVEKGFTQGMRTMRHCGFQEEYMLKDFLGQDRDAIMFAKYYNDGQDNESI